MFVSIINITELSLAFLFLKVKKCSPIELPRGFLSCTAPHGEFGLGARCKSTCEEGFVLTGDTDTECTPRGEWSTETPQCLRKKSYPEKK